VEAVREVKGQGNADHDEQQEHVVHGSLLPAEKSWLH
jgi:hypothetical protein